MAQWSKPATAHCSGPRMTANSGRDDAEPSHRGQVGPTAIWMNASIRATVRLGRGVLRYLQRALEQLHGHRHSTQSPKSILRRVFHRGGRASGGVRAKLAAVPGIRATQAVAARRAAHAPLPRGREGRGCPCGGGRSGRAGAVREPRPGVLRRGTHDGDALLAA